MLVPPYFKKDYAVAPTNSNPKAYLSEVSGIFKWDVPLSFLRIDYFKLVS
jgi:hypothetical protein